jgi:hypothetical protein
MSENCDELIIDPELLAEIQRQCRQRAAELEAAGSLLGLPLSAPRLLQGGFDVALSPAPPVPAALSEAERFAAAVVEMPANVRRFFEPEKAVPPWQVESDEDRADEQRLLESMGGWCG